MLVLGALQDASGILIFQGIKEGKARAWRPETTGSPALHKNSDGVTRCCSFEKPYFKKLRPERLLVQGQAHPRMAAKGPERKRWTTPWVKYPGLLSYRLGLHKPLEPEPHRS